MIFLLFFGPISDFMVLPLSPPLSLLVVIAGPEEAKNHRGASILRLIQIRLATLSLAKIRTASQDNSPQVRIADSSSKRRPQSHATIGSVSV
jgi:hypothetical protein